MTRSKSHSPFNHDRRKFFQTTGHLLLGFTIWQFPFCTSNVQNAPVIAPYRLPPLRAAAGPKAIDSWIRLDANGQVTVLTGKMELGQGIRTALMQIAAE